MSVLGQKLTSAKFGDLSAVGEEQTSTSVDIISFGILALAPAFGLLGALDEARAAARSPMAHKFATTRSATPKGIWFSKVKGEDYKCELLHKLFAGSPP
jgi:hypothetical protein